MQFFTQWIFDALIKAKFMHPALRGRMLAFDKDCPVRVFLLPWNILHSGWKGGNFLACQILGHNLQVEGQEHICPHTKHSASILVPILVFLWDLMLQLPQGEADCGGGGKIMLRVFS